MKPAVRSSSSGKRASWTRISVSADEHVRRGQQRHWLRLHAALTGLLALLLMLAISAGLLQALNLLMTREEFQHRYGELR